MAVTCLAIVAKSANLKSYDCFFYTTRDYITLNHFRKLTQLAVLLVGTLGFQPAIAQQPPDAGDDPNPDSAYYEQYQQQNLHPGSPHAWFSHYDDLRDHTDLTQGEHQRVDSSYHAPGSHRRRYGFYRRAFRRYQRSLDDMKRVDPTSETEQLQRSDYHLCCDWRNLIYDYLQVTTGQVPAQPVVGTFPKQRSAKQYVV